MPVSTALIALWLAAPAAAVAGADGAPATQRGGTLLVQSGDCNAIGEAVAQQNGGTLASASDAVQNGTAVCQVIIVVRGQNGERPRRIEIVVPKG